MSTSVTPASSEAWIACVAPALSTPPHIHPPMAQVPRPMAEQRMPDGPSVVVFMVVFIASSSSR